MRKCALALIIVPILSFAAVPNLPVPDGPFSIGRTWLQLVGETVLVWYPAAKALSPGDYLSQQASADIQASGAYYEQSVETIRPWTQTRTHASDDAPIANGRFPLIIFLPGAGVFAFNYTSLAEQFASHGYLVAVIDYFSPNAPRRNYANNDFAATENDMAHVAVGTLHSLQAMQKWSEHLDPGHLQTAGHSIGGAAAISAARLDRNLRASADMDGAPFGQSLEGAVRPVLVLQSKPLYSDADLAKRGRTREQFEKAGAESRRTWTEFTAKSGTNPRYVLSVLGTGHFSFSDAPFVMPDTITRFGGNIIDPLRGYSVITSCVLEFFEADWQGKAQPPTLRKCISFPEVVSSLPAK
jgi:dienelactone hydrolase